MKKLICLLLAAVLLCECPLSLVSAQTGDSGFAAAAGNAPRELQDADTDGYKVSAAELPVYEQAMNSILDQVESQGVLRYHGANTLSASSAASAANSQSAALTAAGTYTGIQGLPYGWSGTDTFDESDYFIKTTYTATHQYTHNPITVTVKFEITDRDGNTLTPPLSHDVTVKYVITTGSLETFVDASSGTAKLFGVPLFGSVVLPKDSGVATLTFDAHAYDVTTEKYNPLGAAFGVLTYETHGAQPLNSTKVIYPRYIYKRLSDVCSLIASKTAAEDTAADIDLDNLTPEQSAALDEVYIELVGETPVNNYDPYDDNSVSATLIPDGFTSGDTLLLSYSSDNIRKLFAKEAVITFDDDTTATFDPLGTGSVARIGLQSAGMLYTIPNRCGTSLKIKKIEVLPVFPDEGQWVTAFDNAAAPLEVKATGLGDTSTAKITTPGYNVAITASSTDKSTYGAAEKAQLTLALAYNADHARDLTGRIQDALDASSGNIKTLRALVDGVDSPETTLSFQYHRDAAGDVDDYAHLYASAQLSALKTGTHSLVVQYRESDTASEWKTLFNLTKTFTLAHNEAQPAAPTLTYGAADTPILENSTLKISELIAASGGTGEEIPDIDVGVSTSGTSDFPGVYFYSSDEDIGKMEAVPGSAGSYKATLSLTGTKGGLLKVSAVCKNGWEIRLDESDRSFYIHKQTDESYTLSDNDSKWKKANLFSPLTPTSSFSRLTRPTQRHKTKRCFAGRIIRQRAARALIQ